MLLPLGRFCHGRVVPQVRLIFPGSYSAHLRLCAEAAAGPGDFRADDGLH